MKWLGTRMKLLLVLMVCAVAAAAPQVSKVEPSQFDLLEYETPQSRNFLVNALVRRLLAFVRNVINNGSSLFGLPPLDPLELDSFHLVVPAGLINLDLDLKGIHVSGIGSFVDHSAILNLNTLTFDLDISVPALTIRADEYNLVGDLFTAFPLYGKGQAKFVVEGFRFQAKLFLKQSEDGKSVLIDRMENVSFVIPSIKSDLTGVIGGGDIDHIVNAMIEEVVFDYVNRFQGAISLVASRAITAALNPVLGQLNTWGFLAPLLPRA